MTANLIAITHIIRVPVSRTNVTIGSSFMAQQSGMQSFQKRVSTGKSASRQIAPGVLQRP